MAIAAGTRFGPYEVTAAIGAGGMGEVYGARDTTLERDVAIKVLPESFAADAARVARFEREAKTLAALNHLNIAQIYGLEKTDGVHALVMELVEGPTLAERIAQGPLPIEEALNIALQIADALEAAHEQVIIHRDLKPANVKVKPDGTVKVLDFGIAKALDPRVTTGPQAPPLTTPAMTQAGIILGTTAYMAPEQARGKAVDKRADIWAFGCVLYEMLTGQPAFGGEDVTLTLARVLERETDMRALPVGLSPAVRRTLELCLQKDLKKRIRDIGDVRLALKGEFAAGAPTGSLSVRRAWLVAAAALVGGALLTSALLWSLTRPVQTAPPAVVRFTVTPPPDAPLANTGAYDFAISPDGMRLVYVALDQSGYVLYLRELDSLEARAIPGTEIADTGNVSPFFSADGAWIGFGSPGRGIMRIAVDGGPPLKIVDYPATFGGAAWATDDTLIFSSGGGLHRVSAGGGGTPERLTSTSGAGAFHAAPSFLPGERTVLFTDRDATGAERVAVLDLATGEQQPVIDGADAVYTSTGHIVFARTGVLMAVPVDLDSLTVIGEPVTLLQGVRDAVGSAADLVVSATGTLVYMPNAAQTATSSVVWVDRIGNVVGRAVSDLLVNPLSPRLSPDGGRLALLIGAELWIYDLGGRPPILLAEGNNGMPVWSPDGLQLAFTSTRGGAWDLYTAPADGSVREPRPLRSDGFPGAPAVWSDAGELILVSAGADIVAIPVEAEGAVRDVVVTEDREFDPSLSPNGRWLAYASYRTGSLEVWVKEYPDGVAQRISSGGGREPAWSADGTELFYHLFRQGNAMMAVPVETENEFTFGGAVQLFDQPYLSAQGRGAYIHSYDVARDGRFLMIDPSAGTADTTARSIVVVQNWFEELKRRVPRD